MFLRSFSYSHCFPNKNEQRASSSFLLLGKQVRKNGDGRVILQDGSLASSGARRLLVDLLLQDACFHILDCLFSFLFLSILLHLVKHSRHFSWSLVDVDSVILFSLLIGKDLHSRSSTFVSFPLLVLHHHLLVLLGEHFPCGDINGNLPLSSLFLFDFGLLIELLLSFLIFFLSDCLHFRQFILLLFQSLWSSFAIWYDLRESVDVLEGCVFIFQILKTGWCFVLDFGRFTSFICNIFGSILNISCICGSFFLRVIIVVAFILFFLLIMLWLMRLFLMMFFLLVMRVRVRMGMQRVPCRSCFR